MPQRQLIAIAILMTALACGSGGPPADLPQAGAVGLAGLTPFQVENGIGPVTEAVELGPVDPTLVESGRGLFDGRCSACHKMAERYVGPALGDVLDRRTPAYVMNMILDPEAMYARHPEARALLAQYATQMPNMGLTTAEARTVVEYLRSHTDVSR